jgi:DnaA N-terminal domain
VTGRVIRFYFAVRSPASLELWIARSSDQTSFEAKMNASSVWDQVLSRVEARNNPIAFCAWFKPARFIADDDVGLRVSVPNALFLDWFLQHYAPIAEEILAELGRGDTTVTYVVDEGIRSAATDNGTERTAPGAREARTAAASEPTESFPEQNRFTPPHGRDAHARSSSRRLENAQRFAPEVLEVVNAVRHDSMRLDKQRFGKSDHPLRF